MNVKVGEDMEETLQFCFNLPEIKLENGQDMETMRPSTVDVNVLELFRPHIITIGTLQSLAEGCKDKQIDIVDLLGKESVAETANSIYTQLKSGSMVSQTTLELLTCFTDSDWKLVCSHGKRLASLQLSDWQYLLKESKSKILSDFILKNLLIDLLEKYAKISKVTLSAKDTLPESISAFLQILLENSGVMKSSPHEFRQILLFLNLNECVPPLGKKVEVELGKRYMLAHSNDLQALP